MQKIDCKREELPGEMKATITVSKKAGKSGDLKVLGPLSGGPLRGFGEGIN